MGCRQEIPVLFEKIMGVLKVKPSLVLWIALLLSPCLPAQQAIRLKVHTRGARPARIQESATLPRHFILEFRSYPGPGTRRELVRRGIRPLQYLPDNGLMVSAETAPNLTGLDLEFVGPLEPQDKLSPLLASEQVAGYLVVFQLDSDMQEARQTVRANHLDILENPAVLAWQLLVTGDYQDVTALAQDDSVAYVFPASPDLVTGGPVIGCAGAIAEAGPVAEYVAVGDGWAKDTGGGVLLNYFFQSLTEKLTESTVRGEVERAFREWMRYTNLTLSPAQQAGLMRSIDIKFARGAHGDPYPFDSSGLVLAHTFYPSPPNSETVAGDMHFNGDVNWQAGANVDLFTVALHEAGHALGLGHTDLPGAVMYPYYHMASGLTDDDIAGIRSLYGNNAAAPVPPAPTPAPTPTPPPTPAPTPTPTPTPTPPPPPPPPPPNPGPDTIPPSLSITSPGSTIVSTSSASITIGGTARDNVGVAAVKWTTSGGDAGTASGTANWSASVPLLVGNNTVTVTAYDAAGNSSWRAITVVRH